MISPQADKKPSDENCDDDGGNRNGSRDDDGNDTSGDNDDDSKCVDETNPRVKRNSNYKFKLYKKNAKCRSSDNEQVNKLLCC